MRLLARATWVGLAWCIAAFAVEELASLSGTALDPARLPIAHADVSLASEDTGFRRLSRTGDDGQYHIAALQPGVYKITVRKEGFRSVVRFGVRLQAGAASQIDFELPIGSVKEEITVTGEPVRLRGDEASVGTSVGQEWIAHLPLNGRGLLNLLELAPGTVVTPATRGEAGQFTVNGQRPNTHYFELDGVSLNTGVLGGGQPAQPSGGSLPAMTAFGSYHNIIGLDALEEFRVRTSSAAPALGRLPGAQISLVSKAGSNQFHGGLFFFGRHAALSANDWFANRQGFTRGPLHLTDMGASLGGPLRRDRTFFFFSVDRMRFRQPGTWISPVPSRETRSNATAETRELLDLFPLPNGAALAQSTAEWSGRSDRQSTLFAPNLRIDHALTSRVTLFGRASTAASTSNTGGFQRNFLTSDFATGTLGLSASVSRFFVNDVRFSYALASAASVWNQSTNSDACAFQRLALQLNATKPTCGAFYRFAVGGIGQLVSGRETGYRQPQWNLVEAASLSLGNHQARIGGDYRYITPQRLNQGEVINIMADSLDSLLSRTGLWMSTTALQPDRVMARELSLFLQDAWRIRPSLTLTYGLRWEWGPQPQTQADIRDVQSLQGLPDERALWDARLSNVSPRAGLAWRLGRNTVLRVGGGLYFDSSLAVTSDLLNVSGLPYSLWQVASPSPEVSGPARSFVRYGFAPGLRLPQVWQWSTGVERAVTEADVVSATYAGSRGRGLLRREVSGGNTNLSAQADVTNHGAANYHSLQLQWRRRMARHVQVNAAYAWSHSIDNSSSDAVLNWIAPGFAANGDRGSSDFDVRHSLNLAMRMESGARGGRWEIWLRNWALDTSVHVRTGFPINVQYSESAMGVMFANAFRPDLVAGQPIWVSDNRTPGGQRLNRAAFTRRPGFEQGSLGRNAITGFGMSQVDTALNREFQLPGMGRLLLRAEAFNLANQTNFADPVRYLASPSFGKPTAMLNLGLGNGTPASGLSPLLQVGGPRSIQISLRWQF
jgi:Carboxypeptidase regulatory-like domain/TonB dependent receptor